MDTSSQLRCPYCPDHQLDPIGHHAMTCKGGGDVVVRHNALRDVFAQFCHTQEKVINVQPGFFWLVFNKNHPGIERPGWE